MITLSAVTMDEVIVSCFVTPNLQPAMKPSSAVFSILNLNNKNVSAVILILTLNDQ